MNVIYCVYSVIHLLNGIMYIVNTFQTSLHAHPNNYNLELLWMTFTNAHRLQSITVAKKSYFLFAMKRLHQTCSIWSWEFTFNWWFFTAAALRNLIPKDSSLPDIAVAHGEVASNYNNPSLFPGMFPSLYPLHVAGFDEIHCQNKISFRAQAEYYLDMCDHSSFGLQEFHLWHGCSLDRCTNIPLSHASSYIYLQ